MQECDQQQAITRNSNPCLDCNVLLQTWYTTESSCCKIYHITVLWLGQVNYRYIITSVAPTASRVFESLLKHPLSSLTSGYASVFPLSVNRSAIEAVQYSDGDGVIEHFDYFI